MHVGLEVGVGRCSQVWTDMGMGGQVRMGQTDLTGKFDMASGWARVCVQM